MRFGLRELIFLAVLLSVPIASFVFVFKPRNDEIRIAREEIEEKERKLERVQEVSRRIDDIGKAIEDWRDAVRKIEGKLPSQQGVDAILEQVWTIAQANRLTLLSTETQAAVPASTYMELPFKIEIEGDFDAFYQFMLELEQLDRITRIHQLHIERADARRRSSRPGGRQEEVAEGTMRAKFTLSIFYQPEGADRNVAAVN